MIQVVFRQEYGIYYVMMDKLVKKAVELSKKTGYTQQQVYNYNVGCKIIPLSNTKIPSGNLDTVFVTNSTAPYSSQAITYPLDTANPKQQTGSAEGNYNIEWINPIVSLGNYKII